MYQRPGRDEVMYSREVIDEVISRNDIVDVISGYVKLKKNGSSYTGLCPFHNEKSPSFSVSGQRQLYHCFGCGAGGNVITFVMEYENMTFLEAVKMLGERAGVALPQTSMSEEDRKERGIRDRLLEINKIAATYYYRQLRSENGKAGLDYLKKRELSDSTINSFGLGYATQSTGNLYKLLKDKGYDDDILKESGLFTYERGIHEKFWTRVIFPIMDINNKLKHTNYPVVDKNNKCLGLFRITDLSEKNPKQVILVDHNEKKQTADGIDEAVIKEIIDHHNLGSITTSAPVNFRNMAVGSTCTIVYTMFMEREIKIPKNIAGALLSGVLSDTLILKSPTTTERDKEAVKDLARIAGVNYEEYGMEMLKAGTALDGMSKEDVLYNDFKLYTVGEDTFGVGQFFTMNFDEIEKEMDEYVKVLDSIAEANNYSFLALYVTDIIKNGSYVLYNTKAQDKVEIMYANLDVAEGFFVDKCVSRKKNVIPLVMELFEN